MTRVAIYARFSTDMQADRSIEDQVALCRNAATRDGLEVVAVYADRARSGGSIAGRDGILDLMAAARDRAFDVVIVEALDRLSRDMEDLAGIHKRLAFQGIELRAVHDGKADTVTVGLRGLVGQLFREDNARKIRRGLAGRVRDGLSAGGQAYGYRALTGKPGELAIDEAEAAIVRRIFALYITGETPREIAHGLNRDGVRPPRGRRWAASAILGSRSRGSGILANALYNGEIVWDKVRMIRDPDTGRRVSRPNPPEAWQSAPAPRLRILEPGIFAAAAGRRGDRHKAHTWHARRPRRMLSGLLRCGACGSGMSSKGKDPTGRERIRCTAAHESGTCPDPQSFYLDVVERTVVDGLRSELLHPEVISAYVAEYHAERKRLAGSAGTARRAAEARLAALDAEAERCIDMMVKGIGNAARLGARTHEIAAEEERLKAELAALPAEPVAIALHPGILTDYRAKLDRLAAAMAVQAPDDDAERVDALRSLIDTVTVRRAANGIEIDVAGRLNAVLGDHAFPTRRFIGGIDGSGGALRAIPPMGEIRYLLRFPRAA